MSLGESMQTIACPHCAAPTINDQSTAGQLVSCPGCHRQFTMPMLPAVMHGQVIVPQGQPISGWQPQEPQPNTIVFNTAPKPRKRLHSGGWFGRSFATTIGIVLGLLAIPLAGMFLCCGGFGMFAQQAGETAAADRLEVRKMSLKTLKRYGIISISEGASAFRLGDGARLSGACLDGQGESHDVDLSYDVNTFDGTERWEVRRLTIDGDVKQDN